MATDWLTAEDLAELAGMATARRARKALARAAIGERWRGCHLLIREIHGRGGQGGRQHIVHIESLPANLQLARKAARLALKGPLNRSDAAAFEREWRHTVIASALAHPKNSIARANAVRQIARMMHYHPVRGPKSGPEKVSERTVHRWISDRETIGFDALTRCERGDKHSRKVILTARWDKAVSLPEELKEEIAADTRKDVANLWAGGGSLIDVTRLASEHLADRTRKVGGFSGEAAELARVCQLPRNLVEAQRKFRRVHEAATDAKAFSDTRPRLRRSNDLAPMQVVIGDVHHCDVLVSRHDGSTATPKLISWMDVGTGRMRFDPVLCEAGTAVRNADLIRSFLKMVADPHWGMPTNLYLDNGSEYRFAEFIRDALKLAGLHCEPVENRSGLIRATAYNAAAKGKIERAFGVIEQTIFGTMPGYIAGDRMKSRSANVGRAPTPFGGSFAEWADQAQGLLGYYNTRKPRGSALSPSQSYHRAVTEGWQRLDADPDALRAAFSIEIYPKVVKGVISIRGATYYADELFGHEGEKVTVLVPKYEDAGEVPVFAKDGRFICAAGPDRPFGYLSKAGAVEAGRRKRAAGQHVKALQAQVTPANVPARMIASGKTGDPRTPAPPSGGEIKLSGRAQIAGRVTRPIPKSEVDRLHEAKQRSQRERLEMLENMQAGIAALEASRQKGPSE